MEWNKETSCQSESDSENCIEDKPEATKLIPLKPKNIQALLANVQPRSTFDLLPRTPGGLRNGQGERISTSLGEIDFQSAGCEPNRFNFIF